MKDYMKKIITAILLLLVIAVLPSTSWSEDQKTSVSEQKQEEDKVTGQVDFASNVRGMGIWT